MSASFDLSEPAKVTIGTVGPAGARTFYLQARQDDRLVTLKLEKQQVGALAELLTELLSDLPDPAEPPDPSDLELEEPVLAEWVVGSMQLSYDATSDRVVLLAEEIAFAPAGQEPEAVGDDEPEAVGEKEPEAVGEEEPEALDDAGGGAIGRIAFSRAQAFALVQRGATLVSSGRATCPLCGYPMDPGGHSCPKTNGHRAPSL